MRALITGRPGTGKSAITSALAEHGVAAYDLEEVPGVICLEVKASGEPVDWPEGFVDWDYYAWNIQEKPLTEFLSLHANHDVVVSVSASNQGRFYSLFDTVFALTVPSPEILRKRLENRNIHEFGQGPENITRALENYEARTAQYLAAGFIPVDNGRPIEVVTSDIITQLHANK